MPPDDDDDDWAPGFALLLAEGLTPAVVVERVIEVDEPLAVLEVVVVAIEEIAEEVDVAVVDVELDFPTNAARENRALLAQQADSVTFPQQYVLSLLHGVTCASVLVSPPGSCASISR